MLDIKFIRENSEKVQKNILNKNEKADLTTLLVEDEERRKIIQEVEQLKNTRNVVSNTIAQLKKEKKDASPEVNEMQEVSKRIKELDESLKIIENKIEQIVLYIPNMVDASVPIGKNAEDNIEIRTWGTRLEKGFRKNHIELAKLHNLIDFERGTKISGSGFPLFVGKGATLERALINFMLDFHIQNHRYTEVIPPIVVTDDSMRGTGQIPKMQDDMYKCENDNLYLIPTAEVPITNIYRNETLNGKDLTKRLCGYTPCFRREAGSYGKDTRGLLRLHQFNKVEMVKFAKPEDSYNELELLVTDVEDVLKALAIPYRVILLCSGDTSFSSAKTYDIEVWSPCEEKWLEVSSCSNFETFQARRANIKYKKDSASKPEYLHTLNGSGLATPRLMVAILENYQNEVGTITIPTALQHYCHFNLI